MQQRLIASGAGFMPRESSDSDSEAVESPMFDQAPQKPPIFIDPFSVNSFPPTPPNLSPYPHAARTVVNKLPSYSVPHRDQMAVPSLLQQRQTWGPSSGGFDESMDIDFMAGYDNSAGFANAMANSMPLFSQLQPPYGTMNPSLSMRFPEDDCINPGML